MRIIDQGMKTMKYVLCLCIGAALPWFFGFWGFVLAMTIALCDFHIVPDGNQPNCYYRGEEPGRS